MYICNGVMRCSVTPVGRPINTTFHDPSYVFNTELGYDERASGWAFYILVTNSMLKKSYDEARIYNMRYQIWYVD